MNSIQPHQSTQILDSEVQEFLPKMPDELALNILQYLTPKELLLGACLVSKKWKALATDGGLWQSFDLKTIIPGLNQINEEVWARHVDMEKFGLSFKGLKRLDLPKALPKILKVASLKTEENGVTILSVPSGLSLNEFKSVLSSSSTSDFPYAPFLQYHARKEPASLQTEYAPFIEYYGREELASLQSETVKEPYQVVITHSHLADKIHRSSFDAQKELLTQLGCKMPDLLSSTVLIGMTYLTSGERLYRQKKLNLDFKFSACSNVLEEDRPYTFSGAFVEARSGQVSFGIAAFSESGACLLPYKFGSAAMLNLSDEAGL